MNVLFFGTPEFILPIPEALLNAGYKLVIVTTPDKPTGRKQILTPSPVKSWAFNHKIPTLTPERFDTNYHPDLGVLAAYGHIIPQEIIDRFPKGILVVHPSLLPKYRGPSPVQAAILAGDKETGVSIIKMDEKMDHGPIIAQHSIDIGKDETSPDLYDRLFKKSAEMLVQILPDYLEGKVKPQEQDHSQATYTKIITKEDGFIPWEDLQAAIKGQTINHSPSAIYNMIRALSPWPRVWTLLQITDNRGQKTEKRLKILKAHLEKIPITRLIPNLVQMEGKNPISWKQFLEPNPQLN